MYQVFFTLSLGVFSDSSVYRENYSIPPNKPVVSAKNWFVILFQVDSIYIQTSPKNLNKFEEEKSQVLFKASSWADLKSAADEPTRKSRKRKLNKWQWKLKTSENPEQTGIYKNSIFSRKKVFSSFVSAENTENHLNSSSEVTQLDLA